MLQNKKKRKKIIMGKLLVLLLVLVGSVSIGLGFYGFYKDHHNNSFFVVVKDNQPTPFAISAKTPAGSNKSIKYLELLTDQVILLVGEVGSDTTNVASEITKKAKNGKPLYLLIDSPGGSVMDGALIISAMEAVKVPVNTVCMQLCASMAAVIHQYGTKRMMFDRSVLMFHDAAGGVQGYLPHMKAQLAMIDRYVLKADVYIANRSHIQLDDFTNMQSQNIWIDGEDSLGKFNDELVYVDVIADGKTMDMKSLLTPTKTPTQTPPKVSPTMFDITL
jgi:ATP-dependent Clp protease, protease subunit